MSQIASFYLLKDGKKQELPNGDCSGAVYMAIWDYCEEELAIDGRFNAIKDDSVMDCLLFPKKLTDELLSGIGKRDLTELSYEIASSWDLPPEIVKMGLENLLANLKLVDDGEALLYEMV